MTPEQQARGEQLRADVAEHKAAIRKHRLALGRAKAALLEFELACRRGISFTKVPTGVGVIHGRQSHP